VPDLPQKLFYISFISQAEFSITEVLVNESTSTVSPSEILFLPFCHILLSFKLKIHWQNAFLSLHYLLTKTYHSKTKSYESSHSFTELKLIIYENPFNVLCFKSRKLCPFCQLLIFHGKKVKF